MKNGAPSPGRVLEEQFLEPLGLSQNALARALGVSPRTVNEIVLGRRSISARMALRLGAFFRKDPRYWLGLQTEADLAAAGSETPASACAVPSFEEWIAGSTAALGRLAGRAGAAAGANRVYLFGSRAEGSADPDSDYDLALILPDGADLFASVRRAQQALWPRRLPFDLVPIPETEWRAGASVLAREVRRCGVLLFDRNG